MPDNSKKFHQFASESILFKGRSDWYFCYLKAGRIVQVLFFLAQAGSASAKEELEGFARRAAMLPGDIAHLASGEMDAAVVLADVFSLISGVQTLAAATTVSRETAQLLQAEYETLAERLARGSHPSPFVSAEDFSLPSLPERPVSFEQQMSLKAPGPFKDNDSKRHIGHKVDKGQSDRMSLILELVRKKKSLSIKEIGSVIKGCSEKTIQRELGALIQQGLVRKVGERRWSLYLPA